MTLLCTSPAPTHPPIDKHPLNTVPHAEHSCRGPFVDLEPTKSCKNKRSAFLNNNLAALPTFLPGSHKPEACQSVGYDNKGRKVHTVPHRSYPCVSPSTQKKTPTSVSERRRALVQLCSYARVKTIPWSMTYRQQSRKTTHAPQKCARQLFGAYTHVDSYHATANVPRNPNSFVCHHCSTTHQTNNITRKRLYVCVYRTSSVSWRRHSIHLYTRRTTHNGIIRSAGQYNTTPPPPSPPWPITTTSKPSATPTA